MNADRTALTKAMLVRAGPMSQRKMADPGFTAAMFVDRIRCGVEPLPSPNQSRRQDSPEMSLKARDEK